MEAREEVAVRFLSLSLSLSIYIYIYLYLSISTHLYVYIYIYIYITLEPSTGGMEAREEVAVRFRISRKRVLESCR